LTLSRVFSNSSLKTVISTCALESSSVTTIMRPRRVICMRACDTTPAIQTRSPGESLASAVRVKPTSSFS